MLWLLSSDLSALPKPTLKKEPFLENSALRLRSERDGLSVVTCAGLAEGRQAAREVGREERRPKELCDCPEFVGDLNLRVDTGVAGHPRL